MFGRSKKAKVSGHVETLLGRATRVEGDVVFSGGLHLDGRVCGNVHGDPGVAATLWVSEQGTVEGLVDVPNVVLNGAVVGDIHARERLVMGPKARVTGNVYYAVIEMAPGAEVSGKLVPTNTPQPATQAALAGPKGVSNGVSNASEVLDDVAVANVFDARRSRS